jgi:hypothetical protein
MTPGARFCRSCGLSVEHPPEAAGVSSSPQSVEYSSPYAALHYPRAGSRAPSKTPLYVACGIAALAVVAFGLYFAISRLSPPAEPDGQAIASALANQLPPFVQIGATTLDAIDRDESQAEPVFNVRFTATGQLTTTVYLGGREQDGILFLTDPAPQGTPLTVAGSGVVRRAGDAWTAQLNLEKQRLLDAVTPATFAGRRVIVQGSPEEAAYLAARRSRPPAGSDAIHLPDERLNGTFFASMVRSTNLREQKVLAFPSQSAAHAYFASDPDWRSGRMLMTAVTTAASDTATGEKILVVLSNTNGTREQSYSNQETFPLDWINARWKEGFRVTTVSRVGRSWWIVMTKGTDLDVQTLLGPTRQWPVADIKKQYDRSDANMFITDIAHRDPDGFVVVMSSTTTGRLRKQQWYQGWNQTNVEAKLKEGFQFIQGIQDGQTWYVVMTDTGEAGTFEFNEKEFPRGNLLALASKGYRIGWLW